MEVWIAFACGLFVGTFLGFLVVGLVNINRDQRLERTNEELEDRITELTTSRQLLKEEIFRLSKNYKPRKPQPRKKRNYKKKNIKK
tara:strand:- start:716 stop:973 length:258 start_codon:yes stop_codon:yes gene_type:complete